MKIIVRMPNWIGDLIMATPILSDLRSAFPEAEITALCKAPASELLEHDESIDELFSFTRPENKFLRRVSQRNIIEKLRLGKYDLGLLLTGSFSSAWLFWQGRVKRRIGFAQHWRSPFLTDPVPLPKEQMHQVELYKQLLKPLRMKPTSTVPHITLQQRELADVRRLCPHKGRLIGINPGAAYGSAKCWPPERFTELAARLIKEDPELTLLFFGDANSFELVKKICVDLPEQVINLAGVTSLRELACLIKECNLLITNDSGPMHMAAALNVPLIALFGSTDETRTGPYGVREGIINKHVSCSPCFRRTCPIDFRCMKEISVDEVFALATQKRNRV